jgi:hypothetical protein
MENVSSLAEVWWIYLPLLLLGIAVIIHHRAKGTGATLDGCERARSSSLNGDSKPRAPHRLLRSQRDRRFESCFLQQRVVCEPLFLTTTFGCRFGPYAVPRAAQLSSRSALANLFMARDIHCAARRNVSSTRPANRADTPIGTNALAITPYPGR